MRVFHSGENCEYPSVRCHHAEFFGEEAIVFAWTLRKKFPQKKKYYESALAVMVSFLFAAVLWQMDLALQEEWQIPRNHPGQGTEEREYSIDAEGVLQGYPMEVQIEERKLTEAQCQEYFENAKQELDALILGENPSLEQVANPLYLPEALQDGAVEAEYQFSDYDTFGPDGALKIEPKHPITVEVTAELACQGRSCLYSFFVQAVPRQKSPQEGFADQIRSQIMAENEKEGEDSLSLPQKVGGKEVHWEQKTENRSIKILFLGIAGAIGILVSEKEEKKRREAERQRQMLLDYPEIVSKLSLLLGAGMNISLAWEKIALTYRKKRDSQEIEARYAYEEMLGTLYEIQEGIGELQAFGNFGERCSLGDYRKLSSLIVQNIRKGAKGMQQLLDEEAWDAFEQRKARAKIAGEEAGTKLMLPMIMMLAIVLVILMVPAGLSLGL